MTGLACAVAAALAAIAAAPGATTAREAELNLVRMHPVTVQGDGFHSRERVRLVLHEPSGTHRRRARAGASGTFLATFPRAAIARCEPFSITATGRAGSRASVARRAPVGCPP
jgi:hypothetical protein